VLCDLNYGEDSKADADVEPRDDRRGRVRRGQGAAEGAPVQRRKQLAGDARDRRGRIRRIFELQRTALESA
jgi:hypothetical protein